MQGSKQAGNRQKYSVQKHCNAGWLTAGLVAQPILNEQSIGPQRAWAVVKVQPARRRRLPRHLGWPQGHCRQQVCHRIGWHDAPGAAPPVGQQHLGGGGGGLARVLQRRDELQGRQQGADHKQHIHPHHARRGQPAGGAWAEAVVGWRCPAAVLPPSWRASRAGHCGLPEEGVAPSQLVFCFMVLEELPIDVGMKNNHAQAGHCPHAGQALQVYAWRQRWRRPHPARRRELRAIPLADLHHATVCQ